MMKLIVNYKMSTETENIVKTAFVTISDEALNQVRTVIEAQEHTDLFLRIFVQGGCGGVSYGMAIDMKMQADDQVFDVQGVKVVVDRISAPYVEGADVAFDASGEKQGFRITNSNVDLSAQGGGGCCGEASTEQAGCGGGSCGSGGGGGCC